jgi:hypothetical protein
MDRLLVITGSMGSGKSTTLAEASDLLAERDIPHAAIDLDAFGLAYLPNGEDHALMVSNLESACGNYAAAGIGSLLVAAAVESRQELQRIQQATDAVAVVVCRLRTAIAVMENRVATRERGIWSGRYVARVRPLEQILDVAALEDFRIDTTGRTVTEVATELLRCAGWIAE